MLNPTVPAINMQYVIVCLLSVKDSASEWTKSFNLFSFFFFSFLEEVIQATGVSAEVKRAKSTTGQHHGPAMF